jgi:hypothetical protein
MGSIGGVHALSASPKILSLGLLEQSFRLSLFSSHPPLHLKLRPISTKRRARLNAAAFVMRQAIECDCGLPRSSTRRNDGRDPSSLVNRYCRVYIKVRRSSNYAFHQQLSRFHSIIHPRRLETSSTRTGWVHYLSLLWLCLLFQLKQLMGQFGIITHRTFGTVSTSSM